MKVWVKKSWGKKKVGKEISKYKEIFCVDKNEGNPFIFICVDRQTDRQRQKNTKKSFV